LQVDARPVTALAPTATDKALSASDLAGAALDTAVRASFSAAGLDPLL